MWANREASSSKITPDAAPDHEATLELDADMREEVMSCDPARQRREDRAACAVDAMPYPVSFFRPRSGAQCPQLALLVTCSTECASEDAAASLLSAMAMTVCFLLPLFLLPLC
jgi:hypothetical protein